VSLAFYYLFLRFVYRKILEFHEIRIDREKDSNQIIGQNTQEHLAIIAEVENEEDGSEVQIKEDLTPLEETHEFQFLQVYLEPFKVVRAVPVEELTYGEKYILFY